MGTTQGSWPQGAENDNRMPNSRECHTPLTFDRRPCSESNLTFTECRPLFEDAGIPLNDENLWDLGLHTDEGAYTNAALLLSDQCPFITRCIRFEDNTKNTIISKTTIRGSLLRQIREAETFLTQDGALTHVVVREAMTNALIHRDYDHYGPTIINRFASRAEIISLGGLVTGLGNDDLRELRHRHPAHHGRLRREARLPAAAHRSRLGRHRPARADGPAALHTVRRR